METTYPKRLIEVDLPIKRISAHARREKSIRHGHISTLHIWWARRPLAACRAVICAALWPDPADPLCPQSFRDAAARLITEFAGRVWGHGKITTSNLAASCSQESLHRWQFMSDPANALDPKDVSHWNILRFALLDFIADFSNWDNSTVPEYLETARALTQAAHEALGGEPGTRPLVVDPFAGGGSIPLEALRIGADAFASDLNPVAVLLNKVVLEYIPKYGQKLADEVRKSGQWMKEQAEKELVTFYPTDGNGATPIAYLWARTVACEGPGCGALVPLLRSLWLAKASKVSIALRLVPRPRAKHIDFEIVEGAKSREVAEGTVRRGSATCPLCGYTTPVSSVRRQLKDRLGGTVDARMFCVVTTHSGQAGRRYRKPTDKDTEAVRTACDELAKRTKRQHGPLALVPDEVISLNEIRRISAPLYGMTTWGQLFAPRQALALSTLCRLVVEAGKRLASANKDGFADAVQTCLAMAVDRTADFQSSLVTWTAGGEFLGHTFTRQAIPMVWDFAEGNPWANGSGNWEGAVNWVTAVIETGCPTSGSGHVESASASSHPLPDDAVHALVTDPPYYDAVPYAHLADYFYVWLRRSIGNIHKSLLHEEQVVKDEEIVVDRPHELSSSKKDIAFYERELTRAFTEGRRVLRPDGIGLIVFASKTTASWEAILQSVVDAGWTITGSWPVDTEREARMAAQGQARLASSVHLICRPRERSDGLPVETVGDWRDVLAELPKRTHDWMPHLASEGVVGADAIFACLGPALEIYSRYGRVEKASGEPVKLREYLEQVWAAVAREALAMILQGADATGFEEDSRLTVIWFWVLKSLVPEKIETVREDEQEGEEGGESLKSQKVPGWQMEYDAVRKLAQGLGVDLQRLSRPGGVIAIVGKIVVLKTVQSREATLVGVQRGLFGDDESPKRCVKRRTKDPRVAMKSIKERQASLFDEPDEELRSTEPTLFAPFIDGRTLIQRLSDSGATVLDRLHQAMLLFGKSQAALLGPFLTETRMGEDLRFWKLAQALSALYPVGTEEKRWVDGVLARKKGLGF